MKEETIENLQLPDALSYPQPREGEQVRYWRNRQSARLPRPTARVTGTTGCQPVQSAFIYNDRSEVLSAAIGTNIFSHAYDSIGNHVLFSENLTTNTFSHNQVNQMVGRVVLNAPSTAFTYTPDGGLSSDGDWDHAYDAEGQLVSVTSSSLTNGAIRVFNSYDYRHRRISKTVQRLSVTTAPPPSPPIETYEWNTVEYRTFVYDDWNLIHETVAAIDGGTTNTSEIQYFWGLDLSDTLQGAGGVGGLLAVSCNGQFYFPTFGNNGNITKYIDESGNVVASYEYDDFGRVILQSGPLADQFRIRYSTKYHDSKTGLYYYGYRYYSPMLMRWLDRDPIEEQGGVNLYEFCRNSSVGHIDALGLAASLQWNITHPKQGLFRESLSDFLNGGESKTYVYEYPDSATTRLLGHSAVKPIWQEFKAIKKPVSGDYSLNRSINHTARFKDFITDIATGMGLSKTDTGAYDFGVNVLGSFSGTAYIYVRKSKCEKQLKMSIRNVFSVESMLRNPYTRESTITRPFLSPVTTYFNYDITEYL